MNELIRKLICFNCSNIEFALAFDLKWNLHIIIIKKMKKKKRNKKRKKYQIDLAKYSIYINIYFLTQSVYAYRIHF